MATTVTIADTAAKIVKDVSSYKLPKDPSSVKGLSQCADDFYTTKQERFALNKAVEALEKKEALLRDHIIENLGKSSTGVAGKIARASITLKTIVKVTDWKAFYKYIALAAKKDEGAWSLLQKRVGESAVKEIWESGKKIPGLEPEDIKVVSLNKVG